MKKPVNWFRCSMCRAWELRVQRGKCSQCGIGVMLRTSIEKAPGPAVAEQMRAEANAAVQS